MNKLFRLIGVLTLLWTVPMLTACGDDDDEPKKPDTEKPSRPDDDDDDDYDDEKPTRPDDDYDDDENYKSLIIGTWAYEDDGYNQIMAFSPYEEFSFLYEDEYGHDLEEECGTYSISGDRLKLKFDDGERVTVTIVSITKRKTLVLSGEGEKITAKYIGDWDDYFDDEY